MTLVSAALSPCVPGLEREVGWGGAAGQAERESVAVHSGHMPRSSLAISSQLLVPQHLNSQGDGVECRTDLITRLHFVNVFSK